MAESLFPHDEELLLQTVFELYTSKLYKKMVKMKGEHYKELASMDAILEAEVNSLKKKYIEDLARVAFEINKRTFEGIAGITDVELENPGLVGGKKWIRENVKNFEKLANTLPEQLDKERLDRIAETVTEFNEVFSKKISRLESGELSKIDLESMLEEARLAKPNKRIRGIISSLEQVDQFAGDDLKEFRGWIDRRNENWARNEAGNLYSQQVIDIMEVNDFEEYLWVSERDDRVREEHRLYDNGKPRKISDGIMPGEDYGCRCHAEPVE